MQKLKVLKWASKLRVDELCRATLVYHRFATLMLPLPSRSPPGRYCASATPHWQIPIESSDAEDRQQSQRNESGLRLRWAHPVEVSGVLWVRARQVVGCDIGTFLAMAFDSPAQPLGPRS